MISNIIATKMLKPSYRVLSNVGSTVWVKRAGIQRPMTANNNILDETSATFWLNFCVLYFNPPANILAPTTNKILPITDPEIDDLTTSNNPCFKAKNEIISSVAFPNVPFKKPPILGPE